MSQPRQDRPRLLPALLKYWRGRRGLSQLDLALAADVSSRHVSFLETGRASPSAEMILKLAGTLDVPLREQNALLRSAGFAPAFEEPGLDSMQDPQIQRVLERMMTQHEPYPMVVMNRVYDVLAMNEGANALFLSLVDPTKLTMPLNAIKILFEPGGIRAHIVNWEVGAREILSRVQRQALHAPEDERLSKLVDELLAYDNVPEAWHVPDFSKSSQASFAFAFERDNVRLSFMTTLTVFSAPQNVTLEEIQIESYFPLDEVTEATCVSLAGGGG